MQKLREMVIIGVEGAKCSKILHTPLLLCSSLQNSIVLLPFPPINNHVGLDIHNIWYLSSCLWIDYASIGQCESREKWSSLELIMPMTFNPAFGSIENHDKIGPPTSKQHL